MKKYNAIGLMSGTSLDGVDIVFAEFVLKDGSWQFEIKHGKTYVYTMEWKNILRNIHYSTPAFEFLKIDQEYGIFLGNLVNEFVKEYDIKPGLVASHGHTIFHQPFKGITSQIGNANNIAAVTGLPVVSDFRSKDVALGGNGAPLVPFGDLHLFPQYKYCLNLGGFANISVKTQGHIIAFDICPVNIIINSIVADIGLEYDDQGILGKRGEVNHEFLNALNKLDYYQEKGPKSLGKEWLEEKFIPTMYSFNISVEDKLRTIYLHIAEQINKIVENDNEKLLITGGGAYNSYLISLIKTKLKQEVVLPENEIINFKEALIFAFLGTMRMQEKINCFSSVTGATKDSIGGVMVL